MNFLDYLDANLKGFQTPYIDITISKKCDCSVCICKDYKKIDLTKEEKINILETELRKLKSMLKA